MWIWWKTIPAHSWGFSVCFPSVLSFARPDSCLARGRSGINSKSLPPVYTMLGTLNTSKQLTHLFPSETPWGLKIRTLSHRNGTRPAQSVQLVSSEASIHSQALWLETILYCLPGGRAVAWGSNHLDSVPDLLLTLYGPLHFITLGHSCVLLHEYCFKTRRPLTSLTISDDLSVIYLKKIMAWEKEMPSAVRELLYLRATF